MSTELIGADTHSSWGEGGMAPREHIDLGPHDEGFGAGGVGPPPTTMKDLELGVAPSPLRLAFTLTVTFECLKTEFCRRSAWSG